MTLSRSGISPMLLLFFKELVANLEEERKLGLLVGLVVERQLLSALKSREPLAIVCINYVMMPPITFL